MSRVGQRKRRQSGKSPPMSTDARESTGRGGKSAAVREQAILALLSEKTLGAAATTCGVNEKTLRRWLANDEAFQADYAEARQATFEAGMGRIQALTARAVDTLEDLLDAEKYPSVRLGAARTVAEIGIHPRCRHHHAEAGRIRSGAAATIASRERCDAGFIEGCAVSGETADRGRRAQELWWSAPTLPDGLCARKRARSSMARGGIGRAVSLWGRIQVRHYGG